MPVATQLYQRTSAASAQKDRALGDHRHTRSHTHTHAHSVRTHRSQHGSPDEPTHLSMLLAHMPRHVHSGLWRRKATRQLEISQAGSSVQPCCKDCPMCQGTPRHPSMAGSFVLMAALPPPLHTHAHTPPRHHAHHDHATPVATATLVFTRPWCVAIDGQADVTCCWLCCVDPKRSVQQIGLRSHRTVL